MGTNKRHCPLFVVLSDIYAEVLDTTVRSLRLLLVEGLSEFGVVVTVVVHLRNLPTDFCITYLIFNDAVDSTE
jgi:hypothetical protein